MQCPYCGATGDDIVQDTGGPTRCTKCGRILAPGILARAPLGPPPTHESDAPTAPLTPSQESSGHWLLAESGSLAGRSFPIDSSGLRVGRHPAQNQLVLDDPESSRQHARLYLDAQGRVCLENSSVNGTFVNDRKVEQAVLQPGDRIRFGLNATSVFMYRAGGDEQGYVPPPAAPSAPASPAVPFTPPRETVVAEVVAHQPMKTVRFQPGEEAPPPNARLQLVLDQYAVQDIPLTSPRLQLGSAPGPGRVVIQDPTVSANHAELSFTREGYALLKDLGSHNGTFVNGEKIQERILREGDLVQLGACESHLLLYREARRRPLVLKDIELNQPVITLGRAAGNQVLLNHPSVSQFHAEIHRQGNTLVLLDKGSTNGTFVNGMRINRQVLQPRDRLSLGAIQLIFDGSSIEQHSDGTDVRLYAYELRRTVPNPTRVLLDRVSLAIEPREFVGLLGPSGAGKTTLMHALNGSQPAQAGAVLLNSWDLYQDYPALRALMGYLPQEDILHRSLTVRQCLYYSAKLRLPDDYGEKEIWARVNEVIKILDLDQRANLVIDRLSGGQRKRVSLGIELLSKPALLFMDEPTSGQDPRTEMKMMQLFREIANRGSTIVATTHLLGSFSLLDKVAVLVEGRLAYFGPSQEMLPYFRASRPPEVYDKLREKPPEVWAKEYRTSSIFRECVANPLGEQAAARPAPAAAAAARSAPRLSEQKRSWVRQLSTLLSRQLTLRLGDWGNVLGLFVPPVVIALLVGSMKQHETQSDGSLKVITNEPKMLFMIVFTALWFGCSASVREIVDEKLIYRRERERNLSIPNYLASKLIYLVAVGLVQSGVFISLLTLMGSQDNHFWGAWGIMWMLMLQGALIGLVISATSPTPERALYIFPLALIPQLLLAGLFIPVEKPEKAFTAVHVGNQVMIKDTPKEFIPEGMEDLLRYGVSPVMVGRWGLESLADLYIHDYENYSYLNLNQVTITLHEDEFVRARRHAEAERAHKEPDASDKETALPAYLAVLSAFAVLMITVTAVALKLKD